MLDDVNPLIATQKVPMERWEVFLRALRDKVSKASMEHPTVHCWKPSDLRSLISEVIKENRRLLLTTFPNASQAMDLLKRIGWIHSVKVQSAQGMGSFEFLLMDMEATEEDPIDPLELLQAYLPGGVVCYFSALAYYELTTQLPTHHHIARLSRPRPRLEWEKEPGLDLKEKRESGDRNPLGTEVFRFQDTAFFLTRRDASLVAGIQMRIVSARRWLRITTLEQALLDTLIHPARCGGEAVIMEAWEGGAERLDADRLAEHLGSIKREDLDRRVGAMLDLIGVNFKTTSLGRRLKKTRERLASAEPGMIELPLLPDLQFPNSNKTWRIRVP